jgi:hypothetical protein
LQVAFSHDKATRSQCVDFIGLYYWEQSFWLPSTIPLAGWWPSVGTTLADFQKHLLEMHVPFLTDSQLTWESQTSLTVGIGVGVCFTINGGEPIIDSMQYAARGNAANQTLNPTGTKPAS